MTQDAFSERVKTIEEEWDYKAKTNLRRAIWAEKEPGAWENRIPVCMDALLKGVQLSPDAIILDIGCGIGRLMKAFSPKVKMVYGIDISAEMIKKGEEYLQGIANTKIYKTNGKDLSLFPESTFDFVYSMVTFQHFSTKKLFIDYCHEIYRVLKPEGLTRIQIHTGNSFKKGNISPHHRKGYLPVKEFKTILNQAGFIVERADKRLIYRQWAWFSGRKPSPEEKERIQRNVHQDQSFFSKLVRRLKHG